MAITDIRIIEEPISALREYGQVPIAFEVRSVLDIEVLGNGLEGFRMRERRVEQPWVKDYDAIANEGPTRWGKHWDISNWAVISAFVENSRVGGCVIAYNTDGVFKLEGREDIAVLWDLRVAPDYRGQGIGGRLVEAALSWAELHDCRLLKVETQSINVPACRFYAKHGFVLGAINRFAYPELPNEVELIWVRKL